MAYWNPNSGCLALAACLVASGCGGRSEADVIEGSTVALRGEHVVLTPDQVTCGEKEGLWTISQTGYGAIGRLTPAGRKLFGSDVEMGDRRFTGPVAQLTGEGKLKVNKISSVKPEGSTGKLVTGSFGVPIDHSCFSEPLLLLGSDLGHFSQTADPQIQLTNKDGWTADRIRH